MNIFQEIDYYDDIFNDDSNRRLNFNVPLRYLRDVQDPYNCENFKKRYRFSQDVVKSVILPLIDQDLRKPYNRGHPIAPELQILVCLRFYATASFQVSFFYSHYNIINRRVKLERLIIVIKQNI